MTTSEISNRLDVVLNKSYNGISINEYDKSLYLTRAQSYVVEKALDKYEYGDRIRHILGKLVIEKVLTPADVLTTADGYVLLPLDADVKAILFESTNTSIKTIPLDYNDLHYTLNNPFRQPSAEIAYRVTEDLKVKLYTSEIFVKYLYIYCKVPQVIILEALPFGLEINGKSSPQTSELPRDTVHRIIDVAAHLIHKDRIKNTPRPKEKEETK